MNLYHFNEGAVRTMAWRPGADLSGEASGFYWLELVRPALPGDLPALQQVAQSLGGGTVLDLHCRDLMSEQHPSHYDDTSTYDRIVFRRLMRHSSDLEGTAIFRDVDTDAVSFILFDRLLISVHPVGCELVERMLERYRFTDPGGLRPRSPGSAEDLMLRMIDVIVDDYLALRKDLSSGLDAWLNELLKVNSRMKDWTGLMRARNTLHNLQDHCEEQQDALQEWLSGYAQPDLPRALQAERDAVVARARDLIEHLQRVAQHIRRLEASAETSVQIYFGAQSHRTNNIMRTLTAITAIFLPLNLITGFFGMNFEFLPLIHKPEGLWWAVSTMVVVAVLLLLVFWRKRYLARSSREA